MTDQSTDDIIKNIRLISSKGIELFQTESDRLVKLISVDLQKIIDIVNEKVRTNEELKKDWRILKEEVGKLEERRVLLLEREKEVDDKIKSVDEQEKEVASLHKILEDRRLVLTAKEQEFEKKRQLFEERTKNYKIATPVSSS